MQHKWHLIGVRITNNICVQHQTLGSPSVEDIRESETFGAQRATPLEARLLWQALMTSSYDRCLIIGVTATHAPEEQKRLKVMRS